MTNENNPNNLKIKDIVVSVATGHEVTVIGFDTLGYPVVETQARQFFSAGSNFKLKPKKVTLHVFYDIQEGKYFAAEEGTGAYMVAISNTVTYIFVKQIGIKV